MTGAFVFFFGEEKKVHSTDWVLACQCVCVFGAKQFVEIDILEIISQCFHFIISSNSGKQSYVDPIPSPKSI